MRRTPWLPYGLVFEPKVGAPAADRAESAGPTFWVVRRRTPIGIQRALGATRMAIIRYFLIENALLCGGGVLRQT